MLAILVASLALAQQPDTVRLSFREALQLARESNPNFARQTLQKANADISFSSSYASRYLPRVNMSLTTPEYVSALRRIVQSDGSESFVPTERRTLASNLEVVQPLPTGGSLRVTGSVTALKQPLADPENRISGATFLGLRLNQSLFGVNNTIRSYRLAKESYARAQSEFTENQRGLARNVLNNYYGLVQALKQAQIDSVLYVRDSLRLAAPYDQNQQAVSEVDSLKFELEVARSAFNRTRSRQALNRSRHQFNDLMGLPSGTIVIPDTAVVVEYTEPDIRYGIEHALEHRSDIQLSRMAVDNRREGLRDAKRTSPITLAINSTMGFDGSGKSYGYRDALQSAVDAQSRSTNVQLEVSVPIFDRFEEQHAVARATNDLRSSELSLDERLRELEGEVSLAAQRIANAHTQLTLAQQQVRITARTLEIQTGRYAANQIGLAEFLIDQASARQAEISLLQAQVELLTANEEWGRVIGLPVFQDQ